ncbi:MAG TPA: hypothetical protein PK938_02330 [Bacteroidaceae bacterium]|nr:hypothetical protein [Bacteroidaceae bacterium]
MFIILFIAFDASLFLKNELISDRKFVSLTLSIGFVTVIFLFLKLLIFCYLQKYPMLFLHHFFKKYNLRNLNKYFIYIEKPFYFYAEKQEKSVVRKMLLEKRCWEGRTGRQNRKAEQEDGIGNMALF